MEKPLLFLRVAHLFFDHQPQRAELGAQRGTGNAQQFGRLDLVSFGVIEHFAKKVCG